MLKRRALASALRVAGEFRVWSVFWACFWMGFSNFGGECGFRVLGFEGLGVRAYMCV